jgi:uncharacterized membrane protein
MAHARHSVTVPRPISEVYAFLADGLNDSKWRPDLIEVHLESGTAGDVGAVYAQTMKGPGGRRIKGDSRITVATPPTRLEFEVIAGPARPLGSFELAKLSPTSTEVSFTLDLVPTGLMKLMSSMIDKQVESEAAAIMRLPEAMAG